MPTLHVLCAKEDFDPRRIDEHVVVVLDVLFATSTIVYAISEGIESVWPAVDSSEAEAIASHLSHCVRAGEYLAQPLPGFVDATPLLLGRESLRGREMVYCTTNGTVALRRAADAAFVYPAALLNGAALATHIVRCHPGAPVLIVCSGTLGKFNLEDFYGAGHIVAHFMKYSGYEPNDAAIAAALLCQQRDAYATLLQSRVGRMMKERSLEHEVEYASRCDTLEVVARLEAGRIRRVST